MSVDAKTRRNAAHAAARLAAIHLDIGYAESFLLSEIINTVRPKDWEEGGEPVCFASPITLAARLHCTDRAIRRRMARLEEAGLIVRRTTARGRRSDGRFDADGFRREAEGIDLAPAIAAHAKYKAIDEQNRARVREDRAAWSALLALKARAVAALRRAEAVAAGAPPRAPSPAVAALTEALVALPVRLSLDVMGLLRGLHDALAAALDALAAALPACGRAASSVHDASARSDAGVRRTTSTTDYIPPGYCSRPVDDEAVPAGRGQVVSEERQGNGGGGFEGRKRNRPMVTAERTGRPDGSTGAELVAAEVALAAASARFVAVYDMQAERGWAGIFAAAALLRPDIGIHESAWGDACASMGRQGAALAVLVADARDQRGELRAQPGGYLRGLIRKAEAGALRLSPTVHGLAGMGRAARC